MHLALKDRDQRHATHGARPLKRRKLTALENSTLNPNDVKPWAVLREAKIGCVEHAPRNKVLVVQPFPQGLQILREGVTVCDRGQPLDVFQKEALRGLVVDVLVDVEENLSTTLPVIFALAEPCA